MTSYLFNQPYIKLWKIFPSQPSLLFTLESTTNFVMFERKIYCPKKSSRSQYHWNYLCWIWKSFLLSYNTLIICRTSLSYCSTDLMSPTNIFLLVREIPVFRTTPVFSKNLVIIETLKTSVSYSAKQVCANFLIQYNK